MACVCVFGIRVCFLFWLLCFLVWGHHLLTHFQEAREIMASLGIKKFTDLIGRTDLLRRGCSAALFCCAGQLASHAPCFWPRSSTCSVSHSLALWRCFNRFAYFEGFCCASLGLASCRLLCCASPCPAFRTPGASLVGLLSLGKRSDLAGFCQATRTRKRNQAAMIWTKLELKLNLKAILGSNSYFKKHTLALIKLFFYRAFYRGQPGFPCK